MVFFVPFSLCCLFFLVAFVCYLFKKFASISRVERTMIDTKYVFLSLLACYIYFYFFVFVFNLLKKFAAISGVKRTMIDTKLCVSLFTGLL